MSSMVYSLVTAGLFAQSGNQSNSASWAVVVFCVFLGVAVALLPARRTSEIKRPKDD
jgi:L-cystine uptake protein TcyP (sodium:dicarboxylate symporter family)